MQIEIKINGEAAELQDVLRALLNSSTEQATEAQPKPKSRKPGDVVKVETPKVAMTDVENHVRTVPEFAKHQSETQSAFKDVAPDLAISAAEPQTAISFEEFRKAVGAAALKNKAAVKAIIVDKYGAPRTADVKPEDYAAIIEELKAL